MKNDIKHLLFIINLYRQLEKKLFDDDKFEAALLSSVIAQYIKLHEIDISLIEGLEDL
jgi:hypothetical protein